MNLKIIQKAKNGEMKINFGLSVIFIICMSFIFGIGLFLSYFSIKYIFDYLYFNQGFIFKNIMPVIELLILFFVVLALAKFSLKREKT